MRITLQYFQANPAHLQLCILDTNFRVLTPENKMEASQWVLHSLPFSSSLAAPQFLKLESNSHRALGVSNRLCSHKFDL